LWRTHAYNLFKMCAVLAVGTPLKSGLPENIHSYINCCTTKRKKNILTPTAVLLFVTRPTCGEATSAVESVGWR